MIRHSLLLILLLLVPAWGRAQQPAYPPAAEVKAAFQKLLDRPKISLDAGAESVTKDGPFTVIQTSFASEKKADGKMERVPVLIVKPTSAKPLPACIVLHGTGGNKEGQLGFLKDLAKRGIIGIAIDARYHGGRSGGAKGAAAYNQAITQAWKTPAGLPHEHPFYYDTVWDLWRTVDYLQQRGDVDGQRIGMIGFSMGGIQTWLAASVDERVAVAVPAIGVQSFRWSLENEQWQGRANTIKASHETAAKDLGEPAVNRKVCQALWNKVIPGILDQFDCPSMLRLFAGRPMLIINGENDPNCPLGGAKIAFASAEKAYKEAGASERLRILIGKGVSHAVTSEQRQEALVWFEKWLK